MHKFMGLNLIQMIKARYVCHYPTFAFSGVRRVLVSFSLHRISTVLLHLRQRIWAASVIILSLLLFFLVISFSKSSNPTSRHRVHLNPNSFPLLTIVSTFYWDYSLSNLNSHCRNFLVSCDWCLESIHRMNFAASLCKRVNIRELVTNVPAYAGATGTEFNCYWPTRNWNCLVCDALGFVDFWYLELSGGGLALVFRRWATKKTAGSTKNGRDSNPKNLGVKKFGGEVSWFVPFNNWSSLVHVVVYNYRTVDGNQPSSKWEYWLLSGDWSSLLQK